ncbi:MAG: transcriptional regulator [Planctomycetota bacterium]
MSIDEHDREFLRVLASSGPMSVDSLCDHFHVTPTAIRQRLSRFQAADSVERVAVKQGRGRPRYDYAITNAGRRRLRENYEELATVLWRELCSSSDEAVRAAALDHMAKALSERYGAEVGDGDLATRMAQLGEALRNFGFDVQMVEGPDGPALQEVSCPYHDLAEQDRHLCELEREVFQRVLGTEMVLKNCCMSGDSCCEFVPAPAGLAVIGNGGAS